MLRLFMQVRNDVLLPQMWRLRSQDELYIQQKDWGSGCPAQWQSASDPTPVSLCARNTRFGTTPPFYLMLSGLAGIERILISEIQVHQRPSTSGTHTRVLHLQVPSSNSTDPFVLHAFRGLDSGFRLKFDLEAVLNGIYWHIPG